MALRVDRPSLEGELFGWVLMEQKNAFKEYVICITAVGVGVIEEEGLKAYISNANIYSNTHVL